MGCGISTANLPSYMRAGRNPATKKNGRLGFDNEDDDHKVAIIGHSNYSSAVDLLEDDPTSNRKISISSEHDVANEKENDPSRDQKINVPSPRNNLPKLVIPKEKDHAIFQNDNRNVSERNNRTSCYEKENDESEYDESNIGNSSWIGSPSFRDYCGNSRDLEDFNGKSDGDNNETKKQGLNESSPKPQADDLATSVERPDTIYSKNEGSETINSKNERSEMINSKNEGYETINSKNERSAKNEGLVDSNSNYSDGRRKRGSGLKKVFPNGKSTAFKNLATCYNPNHATSRVGEGH